MTVLSRLSLAWHRWRSLVAQELLRDPEILIFHSDGDQPVSAFRGDARVGK